MGELPPPGNAEIRLADHGIEVTVLPGKGCDIFSVVEPHSGIDVLYKPPWGVRPGPSGAWTPDSSAHWIQAYTGGWQVLLPNAGAEWSAAGTTWGFHGEAALCAWETVSLAGRQASFATTLVSAPLRVERDIAVAGNELRLHERVTNESPIAIRCAWAHHPAFGAPLIAPGTQVSTSARRFTADRRAPGPELAPGVEAAWPDAAGAGEESIDLSRIPGREVRREAFGSLSQFDGVPRYRIANPELGLGVEVQWTGETLPFAWYWCELGATEAFPWFGRGYALAIEPSSVPTGGLEDGQGGVALEAGGSAAVEITLRLLAGAGLP